MNDWDGPDRDLAKVPPGLPDAPVRQTSQVALWMVGQGYATGHGDTLDDLLGELVHQVHANALLEAHNVAQEASNCGVVVKREDLADMIDSWEDAASYKGDFLRQKHGDTEEIAKYRARYLAL